MFTAGLDIGSRMTKAVLFDIRQNKILGTRISDTGIKPGETSMLLLNELLEEYGIKKEQLSGIASTGYGRRRLDIAEIQIPEISCHALGVHFLIPNARTVIDIGGQDSKVISINENGKVLDFVMNDKCAAGTGRFLEIVSEILDTDVEGLSIIAESADDVVALSNTCVVFAESEIIGLIAEGVEPGVIAASVYESVASRVRQLASSLKLEDDIVFTGGVAQATGACKAMSRILNTQVLIPSIPSYTGALGAALKAVNR
ncbi:MAG: acyl-CoA dehydratase activase [Candidatus Cloacimonetes bacterium]|nr:acyl-CoA dehydratase activase [Candidatus Cloacimonadota bacterium]